MVPKTSYPYIFFNRWAILVLCGLMLGFAIATFNGFYFYDDLAYMKYAHLVASGNYLPDHEIHGHRFGLILPMALLYLLFGVNDVSSTLWPMVATTGTAVLVYFLLSKTGRVKAVFAASIFGLHYYVLFFSNKVYPDLVLGFFILSGFVALWWSADRKPSYAILPALLFFFALATKETFVYVLPYIIWFLLIGPKHQVRSRLVFAATFLLAAIALCMYFHFAAGDFFYLLNTVQNNHYEDGLSYFDKPVIDLLLRLTYGPVQMLVNTGMVTLLIFSLPSFVHFKRLSGGKGALLEKHITALVIGMLFLFWFMTTSFRYYNPIPLNPRMFFPLLPFLAILSAINLWRLKDGTSWPFIYGMAFFFAAVAASYGGQENFSGLYMGFAMLFICINFMQGRFTRPARLVAFAALLLAHPLYTLKKPKQPDYFEEKSVFPDFLNNPAAGTLLVTDPRLKNAYGYYYAFEPPEELTVVSFCELGQQDYAAYGQIYLLENRATIQYLKDHASICTMQVPGQEIYNGRYVSLKKWK